MHETYVSIIINHRDSDLQGHFHFIGPELEGLCKCISESSANQGSSDDNEPCRKGLVCISFTVCVNKTIKLHKVLKYRLCGVYIVWLWELGAKGIQRSLKS